MDDGGGAGKGRSEITVITDRTGAGGKFKALTMRHGIRLMMAVIHILGVP